MKTETYYAVMLITPPAYKGGTNHNALATDNRGQPALFGLKHRALCFRDDCKSNAIIGTKAEIIRVTLQWDTPEKFKAA